MEYIQCPHCDKKYAVNDKLRAAAGKKIRCKYCQYGFEIIIRKMDSPTEAKPDDKSERESAEKPETEHQNDTEKETAVTASSSGQKDDATTPQNDTDSSLATETPKAPEQSSQQPNEQSIPKKKTFNIQLIITIVLGLILCVALTVGGYLWFYKSQAPGLSEQNSTQIMPSPTLIKPFDDLAADDVQQNEQKIEQQTSPSGQADKPSAAKSAAQLCKNNAADYWLRSHKLSTQSMDSKTFVTLMDQNLEQAEAIRKFCKNKSLVGKIITSVRSKQKPDWLKTAINARLETERQQAQLEKDSKSP